MLFRSRLGRVIQSCLNPAVWVLILDETLFLRPFKTRLSSTFLAGTFLTLPRVNSLGPCSHQVQWFRVVQKHNECLPSQVPHRAHVTHMTQIPTIT